MMNGFQVEAGVDDQEGMFLKMAAGEIRQSIFAEWLRRRIVPLTQ